MDDQHETQGNAKGERRGNGERAIASGLKEDDRICVSVAEASRLSGLGRTSLYEEMKAMRLAYILRRGRRLIPLAALRDYLSDG